MDSIFEILMNLAIFKGASREAIHAFVEKTHLEFTKYFPGEVILNRNDNCENVVCLLSGSVVSERMVCKEGLIVRETLGPQVVLAAEHLFGMDRKYACHVRARDNCGVMSFSKKRYLELIKNNEVFLLNYLNFLSLQAQKMRMSIGNFRMVNALAELAFLVDITTSRRGCDIQLESTQMPMIKFLQLNIGTAQQDIAALQERGLLNVVSDYLINIPSRAKLIEAAL